MTNIYEIINNMSTNVNSVAECDTATDELTKAFCQYINGAMITYITFGKGVVTEASGDKFDEIIITATFDSGETKRLSLHHTINNPKLASFHSQDYVDNYNSAFELYTTLSKKRTELRVTELSEKRAADKKAEADKRAEIQYEKQKEKSIKAFERMTNKEEDVEQVDEFYFALGWLAKHVGTVSAALPDYLENAFVKYFGNDAPCRVVDSKKRGPAGYQSQWTWSFKASLKKHESIPSYLVSKLSESGKDISDTSFIWSIVDNYGFKFGKKQDIDEIRNHVPEQFMSSFDDGFDY